MDVRVMVLLGKLWQVEMTEAYTHGKASGQEPLHHHFGFFFI